MNGSTEVPELERVTFFNGERLTAGDLTEAQRALRELHWLHNRSLHTWGIATGLRVAGRKGDAQVVVSPGHALDSIGRDILFAEPMSQTVPADPGAPGGVPALYFLTISWPDELDLTISETRAGVCTPGGATRVIEAPKVRWLQTPRSGLDVILAQAQVKDCRLAAPLVFEQRRNARTLQPFIASGQTAPEETRWELLRVGTADVGVSTHVDTSHAGFNGTPSYYAQIMGDRVFRSGGEAGDDVVLDGFARVHTARRDGFTLDVWLPQGTFASGARLNQTSHLVEAVSGFGWHVSWVGIEGT